MTFLNLLQTISAFSGITIILLGSLWLKNHLKRSFCC